ncbi:Kelch repeat-containing protein [Fodinicola acaciae]|uniref:Kelch repeat-containing protein n=1 Tax=Fodinicola acaciae TaxID=2681555 RepID=UPI0013D5AB5F|nr:kelch repeat-containing protein [Fodinicola acaciae]
MRRIGLVLVVLLGLLISPTAAHATGSGTWKTLVTTGVGPSERSVPAVAGASNNWLYVFGGVKDDFTTGTNTFYNDAYVLDVRASQWRQIQPTSAGGPAGRAFAASATTPDARFYVFGGSTYNDQGGDFHAFDDLWSLSGRVWTKLASGPVGRSGATMWSAGGKLYVFGGIGADFATRNDLWSYDIATNKWQEVLPNGAAGNPPTRHAAQAGPVAVNNQLTFYGGEGDPAQGFPVLADTWQFDVLRQRWTEVTPAVGDITPARNYGAAGVLGGGLYLQGGDVPGGSAGCGAPFPQNPTNELWRFDLTSRTWDQLKPAGEPMPRIKRHAAGVINGRLYLVSGWDFSCPGGTGPGQVWNKNTYVFTP